MWVCLGVVYLPLRHQDTKEHEGIFVELRVLESLWRKERCAKWPDEFSMKSL
jgi:hypothetical protein